MTHRQDSRPTRRSDVRQRTGAMAMVMLALAASSVTVMFVDSVAAVSVMDADRPAVPIG